VVCSNIFRFCLVKNPPSGTLVDRICTLQKREVVFSGGFPENLYIYFPSTIILCFMFLRIGTLSLCMLFAACGSQKRMTMPAMHIDPDHPPLSEVRIPIRINLAQLEQRLNTELGEVLFEDEDTDGQGLHLRATRRKPITLYVEEDAIEYVVSMDVWLKKPYRITDVEGTGALEVRMRTNYAIRTDWSFSTSTQILSHQWLEKPKVKVGFLNLPVEFIANKALEKSKALLGQTIDDQISNMLDLRVTIDEAWDQMYQPMLLSNDYPAWMTLQPVNLGMTPLTSDGQEWLSTITVQARPEVFLGSEPNAVMAPQLPPFQWQEPSGDGFSVFIRTEVPYDQAEAVARMNLVGETFEQSGKEVTITGIDIFGKGNKIAVEASLEGAFSGVVELLMRPSFDDRTDAFDIKLEKVEVRTGNFLYKSIAWMFKGKIQKELEGQLRQFLNENLQMLHETVEGQMSSENVAEGLHLQGTLSNLALRSALVKTDYLELWIEMNGAMELEVNEFLEVE
jgi:hypothetical protein